MNKISNNLITMMLSTSLLLTSMNANALEWLMKGGLKSGGGAAYSIVDYNNTRYSLEAGSGLSFAIGFNYALPNELNLRTTIGIVKNDLSGKEVVSNTPFKYKWSHLPVDFLVFKKTKSWNYGAGLTLHLNPETKGSGYFEGQGSKYDNAVGLIAEVDYLFSKNFFIGLNYQLISYKTNNSKTLSGSGFGLDMGLIFVGW